MSCGVGRRRSLDPTLLWLWCRLAAVAPLGPLAWEPPYAEGVALEKIKNKTNKQKKQMKLLLLITFEISMPGCCLCVSNDLQYKKVTQGTLPNIL